MPVEGQPPQGIEHPEHGEVEGVPGGDVAGTATAWTITGEGITKVLLIWHQFGATGIQCTFNQNQGGGVQAEGNGVVYQEVTGANG